jgi:hypothetical protein
MVWNSAAPATRVSSGITPEAAIMTDIVPQIYSVTAINGSADSPNAIHDDDVAQRFGFTGGLVPGVEIYAYMTHFPISRWGIDWLAGGTAEIRLLKPVYDGNVANVLCEPGEDGALRLQVASLDALCAIGSAGLPANPPRVDMSLFPATLPGENLRPADETTLATGKTIGSRAYTPTMEELRDYIELVSESSPIYAANRLIHPGMTLCLCNWLLEDNAVMPAWIHTGSKVQNLAPASIGQTLTAVGRILSNYKKKGHKMVDIDILLLADGIVPIARVLHTAIYSLRKE